LCPRDPGLLRAEDELKRIFGAKVMREVEEAEAAAPPGPWAAKGNRGPLPVPRGAGRQGRGNKRQGRVSAGRKFHPSSRSTPGRRSRGGAHGAGQGDSWHGRTRGGEGRAAEEGRAGTPGAGQRGGTGAAEAETWFQYVESGDYGRVSRMLDECVGSHDPNEMVNLVAHHP